MEFDMEKMFWGTRMMAQECSWPQVRGFSSCAEFEMTTVISGFINEHKGSGLQFLHI